MAEQDPRQFLQELLSLPTGSYEPSPPPPPNSRVGGYPRYRMRGGERARAKTIHFLKQRTLPHIQVHAVTFENEDGQVWNQVCLIAQDEQGFWHEMGASKFRKEKMEEQATRSFPWIRTLGRAKEDLLWIGGYVNNKALDTHLVRLITKNKFILEDMVQDGLVLFLSKQQIEKPVQVELFNRSNELIGTQTLFNYGSYW